jgi:hypothetical protein
MAEPPPDEVIEDLARLFLEHPAWQRAAGQLSEASSSTVYFRHRPGRAWQLVRRGGRTLLEPGASPDPDLVFRFGPESVRRLRETRGGVADFAVRLFSLLDADEPAQRVELRVVAPLRRLMQRGYLRLLLSAGPAVLAFGASHGVRTLGRLRALVESSRSRAPFDFEL